MDGTRRHSAPRRALHQAARERSSESTLDATLGSGNLREAVRLPPGEDINEWLAVNSNILPFRLQFSPNSVVPLKLACLLCFAAVDFFNQVNLLYGTLTEFCTPESCPTMTAGPK